MLYNDLDSFIEDLRLFRQKYPNSYLTMSSKPQLLQVGIEAWLDEYTMEEWFLPSGKLRNSNYLTREQRQIVSNYLLRDGDFSQSKIEFIELLSNQNLPF